MLTGIFETTLWPKNLLAALLSAPIGTFIAYPVVRCAACGHESTFKCFGEH